MDEFIEQMRGVSFEILEEIQILKVMKSLRHEINHSEAFHQLFYNILIRMKCRTTIASHMPFLSDDDLSGKKTASFLVS